MVWILLQYILCKIQNVSNMHALLKVKDQSQRWLQGCLMETMASASSLHLKTPIPSYAFHQASLSNWNASCGLLLQINKQFRKDAEWAEVIESASLSLRRPHDRWDPLTIGEVFRLNMPRFTIFDSTIYNFVDHHVLSEVQYSLNIIMNSVRFQQKWSFQNSWFQSNRPLKWPGCHINTCRYPKKVIDVMHWSMAQLSSRMNVCIKIYATAIKSAKIDFLEGEDKCMLTSMVESPCESIQMLLVDFLMFKLALSNSITPYYHLLLNVNWQNKWRQYCAGQLFH